MQKPLIVIAGPTACGKTKTAIALAKQINGEIISADSMQVYKYMDIGTAKPTKEEMNGVPHYLIDEFYPNEEFNVMIFQKKAKEYIEEIYTKNKIPIVVGGTGFYINALVNDNNFMSTNADNSYRKKLTALAEQQGNEVLFELLQKVDPESAAVIHSNNVKRVIRAIEFYYQTGQTISSHNKEEKQKQTPYQLAFVILNMDRKKLYDRIDVRVDLMIKAGLIEEVQYLLKKGYSRNLVSMQGLGYKEIVSYLMEETTLENAVYELKKNTRHFAKRQLTWFRRQTEGIWLDLTNSSEDCTIKAICNYLTEQAIIKEL